MKNEQSKVLDWESPDNHLPPAKIRDANELEWNDILWINIETGGGERLVRNQDGSLKTGAFGSLIRERFKAATPLSIQWKQTK